MEEIRVAYTVAVTSNINIIVKSSQLKNAVSIIYLSYDLVADNHSTTRSITNFATRK
jgi:hypothetical protein